MDANLRYSFDICYKKQLLTNISTTLYMKISTGKTNLLMSFLLHPNIPPVMIFDDDVVCDK